ncbi:PAP/fibrillin family protein [uncultured Thermosynechococcus sp.]|uniref:PAP/fibrillin family protein n=1 Tax=uncultured Thermosynechococcus sp. TaxID=436945 RepID=UPI00262A2150|nr:PAP/fibrillin family protein [uncultured Thermosynechococcus sp.]
MAKTELLMAIAGLNRGILATPGDRKQVAALATSLEKSSSSHGMGTKLDFLRGGQ